jgi:hypothetical protein
MTKLNEDEQAGYDILAPHMPADLAIDIIKHRRAKKAKLTARVARSLLREYQAFGNVEKAAEIHLTRGWVAFECAWVKQASRFTDQHHPTPRPAVNYGPAEIVPIPQPLSEEERARRAQMAARARQLVRGAIQ